MRLLAHLHMYPPQHNAGAELMIHTILREMVRRGHEAKVIATRGIPNEYEGVEVSAFKTISGQLREYGWCDVALTHLDETQRAMMRARDASKPLVHLVHNDRQLEYHNVTAERAQLVVFNSRWIAEKVRWAGRQMVLRPPVVAEDYRGAPGERITLINLSEAKGANTFYALAEALPGLRFLGVQGAYARQDVRYGLPNVEIWPNTPRARDIYAQTRVLLMPSRYESWGRVGIEAAASGIPTIAHPTPGLLESLGDAGIFCDRDDVDAWVDAINRLSDPLEYGKASARALKRSGELDPTEDFKRIERELHALAVGR